MRAQVAHATDPARAGGRLTQRLALSLGAVLAATIVVLALLAPSKPHPIPRRWLGAFAGWIWSGNVTTVSASWTVPSILGSSSPGRAGTWIGAQAPGDENSPFIQIGSNEELFSVNGGDPAIPAAQTEGVEGYYAFWSDVRHHFHPQYLFAVAPGDRVSANMSLGGGRWRLTIHDVNSGRSRHLATTDEARGSFNEAQWIQEDVTDERTGRLFAYPRLTRVSFAGLRVDRTRPSASDLSSQWMSPKHEVYEAPSPLRNASFSVRRRALGAAAAQFLAIITPLDAADQRFSDEFDRWSSEVTRSSPSAPTQALIDSTCAVQRAILAHRVAALASARWPASAQPLIDRFIALSDRRLGDLAQSHVPQPLTVPAWDDAWEQPDNALGATGRAVRRALGAPDWSPY